MSAIRLLGETIPGKESVYPGTYYTNKGCLLYNMYRDSHDIIILFCPNNNNCRAYGWAAQTLSSFRLTQSVLTGKTCGEISLWRFLAPNVLLCKRTTKYDVDGSASANYIIFRRRVGDKKMSR